MDSCDWRVKQQPANGRSF